MAPKKRLAGSQAASEQFAKKRRKRARRTSSDASLSSTLEKKMAEEWKPPKQRASRAWQPTTMTTRLSSKFGSATAVLSTTELLEKILIQLPMKDLLLAQRVSKKWQEVINTNHKLQRALFFLPEHLSKFDYEEYHKSYGNTCDGLGLQFCWVCTVYDNVTKKAARKTAYVARPNPLLDLDTSCDGHVAKSNSSDEVTRFTWKIPKGDSNASWRRMYLTQPPVLGEYRVLRSLCYAVALGFSQNSNGVEFTNHWSVRAGNLLYAAPGGGNDQDGSGDNGTSTYLVDISGVIETWEGKGRPEYHLMYQLD